MTVAGLLTATLFFLTSRARPLDVLSKRRPPTRVFAFRPATSILLQFAAHLAALARARELCAPFATRSGATRAPDGAFAPSPLNTVVFLLTTLVQLNTFAANYVGEPFTEALLDHKALAGLLAASYAVLLALAADVAPPLATWLRLAASPSPAFRTAFLGVMAADTLAVAAVAGIVR